MTDLDFTATLGVIDGVADVSVVALSDRRDIVRVSGPEAITYLQGQVSQNVAGLAVGASADSFLLDPQGHIEGWFRVTRLADDTVVLDTEAGLGDRIETRLRRFWLRTKAELSTETWDRVALVGPSAARPVEPPNAGFVAERGDGLGIDLLGASVAAPDGVPTGDPAALETLRVRAARPRIDLDAVERTLPAELGVVDQSVDFTKGCYVGQELVARIDSRGNNTPRRLLAFRADSPIDVGSMVTSDGEEAGVVASVAPDREGIVLLASIKRGADPEGLSVAGVRLQPR